MRMSENMGMLGNLRQIRNICETPIAGIVHCDTFLFGVDWGNVVTNSLLEPRVGIVGMFGANGCDPTGVRMGNYTSLVNAGAHGIKWDKRRYCAILDGFAMFYKTELLRKSIISHQYIEQGQYDYDMSLESLRLGYVNVMCPIPCTHVSGITGATGIWVNYLKNKYKRENAYEYVANNNYNFWKRKWQEFLPVNVNPTTGVVEWAKEPPKDNTAFQAFLR